MKSVRRWVYIINVLRALPHVDMNNQFLEIDYRKLRVEYDDDASVFIFDEQTGEIMVVFEEDGNPTHISEWANNGIDWDIYDYPMYE